MYEDYEDFYSDKYAGSYAHDVEGWSDEDIDTVFDGDPEAYWNGILINNKRIQI